MRKYIKEEIATVVVIAALLQLIIIACVSTPQKADAQIRAINFNTELNKIDSQATNGLSGISNSLAYRVHEIEQHIHSRERWLGISANQAGNDWALDTLTPFVAISGADDYGGDASDEAKILGTDDTPIISGSAYFDLHRLLIVDVDHSTPYKLRVVYGTGTMADAITALQYTEVMVMFDAANPTVSAGEPLDIDIPRLAVDTQVWIQAWNATDNSQVDILVGIHEYEG